MPAISRPKKSTRRTNSKTATPKTRPSTKSIRLTEEEFANFRGQLEAINKSQATIEFDLSGTILTANDNFLNTLGYRLEEVQGKHHQLFVDERYAASFEYKQFWQTLREGQFFSGEFMRITKSGSPIWIQATYNPILDTHGKPFKVVKYASNITEKKLLQKAIEETAADVRTRVDTLLSVVDAASAGDLSQTVQISGTDAIAQMGQGLQKLLVDLRASIQGIAQHAQSVSSASHNLAQIGNDLRTAAEVTTRQALGVNASASSVNHNVQDVAASVEQNASAIHEIAKSACQAANLVNEAVIAANSANATVSKLGASSCEIGKVIKVINTIAEQTNLLALNATIEAARAGDSGKGFAVVANEVKELAKATAKATEGISQRVEAIQADTKDAIATIGRIAELVHRVNEVSATIACAVEEQSAIASEISRSLGNANSGTSDIAKGIELLAASSESAMQGVTHSQEAADELAKLAATMQSLVGRFRV